MLISFPVGAGALDPNATSVIRDDVGYLHLILKYLSKFEVHKRYEEYAK